MRIYKKSSRDLQQPPRMTQTSFKKGSRSCHQTPMGMSRFLLPFGSTQQSKSRETYKYSTATCHVQVRFAVFRTSLSSSLFFFSACRWAFFSRPLANTRSSVSLPGNTSTNDTHWYLNLYMSMSLCSPRFGTWLKTWLQLQIPKHRGKTATSQ